MHTRQTAISDRAVSTQVSAFPWYDLPPVQRANDALWRACVLPGSYLRTDDASALWRRRDLLVSQACGLDLFLADAPIEPVAAPVFRLDCAAGHYYSYIVGERNGRRAAVNALSSHSGLTALLTCCQPMSLVVSGSHSKSLAMLRAGLVDVAAIDAVTWHILQAADPDVVAGLPVVDRSVAAMAPPFVARRDMQPQAIIAGLRRAMESDAVAAAREALWIDDVQPVSRAQYAEVLAAFDAVRHRGGALLENGSGAAVADPSMGARAAGAVSKHLKSPVQAE
ncbi:MAG: PhnD/SsuA/transferrin family substrate-binding protein [Pseudomonadota bacterium]